MFEKKEQTPPVNKGGIVTTNIDVGTTHLKVETHYDAYGNPIGAYTRKKFLGIF